MKKSQRINDLIFVILAMLSSITFLFCLILKQDFIAMQCLFFFMSLFFPILVQFAFKIKIAIFAQLIFELFLILHFVFGEILNFYVLFNNYDTILHFVTAVLLTIFGYSIIHYYLDENYMFIQLFFAVLFGMSCEFAWEILEFTIDHFFSTNMQRFIKDGVILSGHLAIRDTIKDMIVAFMGGSSIIFLNKIKFIRNAKISLK